ncbi:hypothetical protein LCGC14_0929060 [marine sediment metagenome]|uniref:Uncharacterized protein n=1 Tax=marine sediment metagenome TaxID=412755 RepID=A0A0F9NNJ4_9ZZZZ
MNEPIQNEWQSGQRSITCYEREIAELKQQRNDLLSVCKNFVEMAKWDKKEFAYIVSDFCHSQIKKVITRAESQQADEPERTG